jgi:hypothetical protein
VRFFFRHILARRNATHYFMGGPKRHIQPERYVQLRLAAKKILSREVKST